MVGAEFLFCLTLIRTTPASSSELQKEHYFSYKPFPYFTSSEDMESDPGSFKLLSISHSIQSQRYDKAREEAAELIDQGLAGIHYIER